MAEFKISRQEIISLCRLCLAKDLASIDIFETGSETRQLFTKIVACLPVQIMTDDSLPKKICEVCNSKVDDFYQFWTSTAKNQKQLNDWLQIATTDSIKTDTTQIKVEADDTRQGEEYDDYDDGGRGDDEDDDDEDAPSAPKRIKTQDSGDEDFKPTNLVESAMEDTSDINGQQGGSNRKSKERQQNINGTKAKRKTNQNATQKPVRKVNRRKKSTADDDIEIKEEGLCSFLLDEQEETVVEKEKTNKIKRNSSSEEDEESDELDDEEDTRNVTSDTKFPCRLCSQEFGTKKQRKKHERKDHETRGVFSCDLCSYTSTRKYYLVKHKSRHIKEYTVFCKKCQLGFLSKNELNVHNIKQHDAQPHTCPVCKKIFVNKFNLTTHKKLHLPMNRNHQCDTCGKSFTGNNHLKRHIYSVHLKRGAQCKICLKVLNSQEALYAHNRIHNDERPFVCPTCGKASRTSSALVVHLRTHTGEKPYKCEFCGKGFTQTSSLAVHRRIHTGQRPHACHLCPDKFVTKSLLNHHMSSRHRDAIHHLEPTPNMPL